MVSSHSVNEPLPERLLCGERAGRDDEEDVEYGRSHDGADAHVRLGDEHADDGGEQLRRGPARGHEGGAGHVGANLQLEKTKGLFMQ